MSREDQTRAPLCCSRKGVGEVRENTQRHEYRWVEGCRSTGVIICDLRWAGDGARELFEKSLFYLILIFSSEVKVQNIQLKSRECVPAAQLF